MLSHPAMLRDLLHRFMVGHWPTHGVWMLGNEASQMPLVTPTTALRHTPVYRACSLIANDVARTELNVDDEIVATFLRQPNRWQTGFEFRRAMTLQACLYGNAFALINRTRGGQLLELVPLGIESVSLDVSTGTPFYKTTQYGDVPMESMLHVRALGLDGLWGESPVNVCRTSLQILAAQEDAQLKVMANAGNPKLALTTTMPLNEKARDAIAADFVAKHAGSANAGKPLVLSDGMKVDRISSTLEDSGISSARKYSVEDVARIYGVPSLLLGVENSTATLGALEWTTRAYADFCLSHWFNAWASEIASKLAGVGTSVVFDTDDLIKPSLAEHFAALRTGVESGIITRNEARDWLNLEPLPGLDEPIVAKNMGTGGGQTNIGTDTSAGSNNDFTP